MIDRSEYNRIYWHSRRGMLELDLVLMPFVENVFPTLNPEEQSRYVKLLACEDQDMFGWFMRRELPQDAELVDIVKRIIAYAESGAAKA